MKKTLSAYMLALALALSIMPFQAFAAGVESSSCGGSESSENPIRLCAVNVIVEESPDGGVSASFDLVKPQDGDPDAQTRIIGWQIVGYGQVKCRLIPDNGIGFFDWEFDLTNGDLIKGVSGTFVLERYSTGRNIAKKAVDETYSVGSLYKRASGSESFDVDPRISRDLKVRFKWSGFKIRGVDDDYFMDNESVIGTVQEFCG